MCFENLYRMYVLHARELFLSKIPGDHKEAVWSSEYLRSTLEEDKKRKALLQEWMVDGTPKPEIDVLGKKLKRTNEPSDKKEYPSSSFKPLTVDRNGQVILPVFLGRSNVRISILQIGISLYYYALYILKNC